MQVRPPTAQVSLGEVNSGTVIYNGPLASAPDRRSKAPLATDDCTVNYCAGALHTACGAVTRVGAHAVAGLSTALSLTKKAQGGFITVTMTVSYSGLTIGTVADELASAAPHDVPTSTQGS